MYYRQTWIFLVLSIVFTAMASAQITVDISNLRGNSGRMFLALYDSPDTFLDENRAMRTEVAPVTASSFSFTFQDLPPGDYALAVFQDCNGNDKLDTGMFGIPKEPYGFSNDAKASFGPPKYEDARFSVGQGSTTIQLTLR
ncbi:MAG: DUF2141 domain-containing protein [Bacteroidota bacterium]